MNKPRLHRDQLRTNIRALDADSGRPLGYLLDLSPGGLGLSGNGENPLDQVQRLRLEFPVRVRDRRALEVPVEYRWLEHTSGHHWHAGFRIDRVPDEDMAVLEHLMTWYADP